MGIRKSPGSGDISVAHDASRGITRQQEYQALEEGNVKRRMDDGCVGCYVAPPGLES
ncbi:MAG TPA: hypothetical protein VF708_06180 [Pyrinomonadaceae bacterium]